MRFWDLSSPEVAVADAEPWDGPFASAMRPVSVRTMTRLYFVGTLLAAQAGALAITFALVLPEQVTHPTVLRVVGAVVIAVGVALAVVPLGLPARTIRRISPLGTLLVIPAMGMATTAGIWASGPDFGITAILYLESLPFAFYLLRLRWALAAAALVLVGFAALLAVQDGWPAPIPQWLLAASTVVGVAWSTGFSAERAERLAESEHQARVELAEVNATLEARVASQVAEIERLGELRRFLAPQVADAVLSGEAEATMRPHRARIAVFFCDLRGFTAFTKESEPEEVVADLDQYYRAVGEVLQRHGATIGGYAGDGIMAYFGDPVRSEEPARAAVAMVGELRRPLDLLVAEWQRRGHDLSYGIGLACGYATLGVVGFDGRYDYTPLGGVVNLAARLCGKAAAGQVLMDHATYAEVDGAAVCTTVEGLELKGLGASRAYALA